jgi:hypothetical protein
MRKLTVIIFMTLAVLLGFVLGILFEDEIGIINILEYQNLITVSKVGLQSCSKVT